MRCHIVVLVGLAGALFNGWPIAVAAQPPADGVEKAIELAVQAEPAPAVDPHAPEAVTESARTKAVARERPVIGLVLSGGGARGGAHLGVLRALEELRVPVDVIAGTSIGAAIGGIYASGLSVDQLEAFVRGIDWDAAFLNDTPRRLRSFRRKRDDDLFLVDQRPGLNRGQLELPAGLVQGQVIDMVMARVTLPAWSEQDFDRLRVPFRAVAGDIETGEAVVLGGGNLARAIRASMTVPAAISPIEIDGHLLVDGGIVMNLPVEIARRMGADIVIAVDISEPLSTRDELNSVVDVTSQLISLLTYRGTARQRELLSGNDVVLTPEFSEEFSSVNFNRLADTIDTGYTVAMEHRDELERLALSPADYARYRDSQLDPQTPELPVVDFLHLNSDGPLADSVIEARLREIEIGVPLDVDAVEKAINRVYGLEIYQNVRYELVEGDDGKTGLELDLEPRSWGPNYVQLGVEYSDASDEDALFGLSLSYLSTAINDLGGEWRALFTLGDEPGFLADFYQPLGSRALYFVAPNLRLESTQLNLFDGDNVAAEVKLRTATLELGLGRELLDWAEVRAGVRRSYGDTRLRVGDPAYLPYENFRDGEWFARFSVDTLDSNSFPRQGIFATAEWTGSRTGLLAADADFDQMRLQTAYAKTWGRHTLLTTMRYDATVSGEAPVYGLFRFGGFLELSGLNHNELTGKYVTQLGTSYYRRIGNLALFPAFAGISVEVGNAWGGRQDISLQDSIWGGSIWAGVDTPVGPVYLGVGTAEGGDQAFYVFLGRLF